MSRIFGIPGILVAILATGALPARAEVVTWTVRGTVSLFTGPTQAIPFAISPGEEYVLTLRLDDSMGASSMGDVSAIYTGGFIDASLTFANGAIPLSFAGSGSTGQLTVVNDAYSLRPTGPVVTDSIDFSGRAVPVNQFNRVLIFGGSRTQSTPPDVLTSLDFPSSSEAAALFSVASLTNFRFTSDIAGRFYAEVNGNVQSVEVSAVPLPAAGWLLLSGFAALRASSARKSR